MVVLSVAKKDYSWVEKMVVTMVVMLVDVKVE